LTEKEKNMKLQTNRHQNDIIREGLHNAGRPDLAEKFTAFPVNLPFPEAKDVLSTVAGQDLGCAMPALRTHFHALVTLERGVTSAILATATDPHDCRRAAVLAAICYAGFTPDDLHHAEEEACRRGCSRLKAAVRALCNALRFDE
jgi:hypothetical protein